MKILARYLSSQFLKAFALSLFGLVSIFVLQQLLGDLLSRTYPAHQVIIYNLMNLPQIFVQMTPPSVLMATVLTLSGMGRTNELTAIFAIGVGLRQIMTVIISLVFMISCFTLVLQDRVIPPLYKKRNSYYWREMKNRPDFYVDVKQDKVWYRSKNFIYNLRSFDSATMTIHGMVIYEFNKIFRLQQVVAAKEAEYHDGTWLLKDGTVTLFQGTDAVPLAKRFKHKELKIDETPQDFREIEKEVDGLRLKELYHYIQRIGSTGTDTKGYEVKLHSRISLSFIPMVMAILAVPFSTRNRREGGVARDLGNCLVVTFFYWLFYSVGLSLGTNGALPPWLAAWLPSSIFVALAVALISHRKRA